MAIVSGMRRLALLGFAGSLVCGPALAGEGRCWIDHGALVVAASFGEIAGDFILDASTPKSQLHLTRAQGDGIEATSARRPLKVAGEHFPAFDMDVVDLDDRTRIFDTTINGVIGADLLRRFVVDIDFSPCRIRLGHGAAKPAAGAMHMAVRDIDGVPTIRASISDGLQSRAGDFAIDTSHATSQITGATLSRTSKPGSDPSTRLRALVLGDHLFEQTPAEVSTTRDAIGTAVWSQGRLRVDLRDGWLEVVFPPLHGEGGLARSDKTGGEHP